MEEILCYCQCQHVDYSLFWFLKKEVIVTELKNIRILHALKWICTLCQTTIPEVFSLLPVCRISGRPVYKFGVSRLTDFEIDPISMEFFLHSAGGLCWYIVSTPVYVDTLYLHQSKLIHCIYTSLHRLV
jgi:hypothetical protein